MKTRKWKLLRMAAVTAVLFSLLCGCSAPAGEGEAGGTAPAEVTEEAAPKEITALVNEEQRTVLSLSFDDFIAACNEVWRETDETDYLAPASEWMALQDVTRFWEYPCVCHSDSADLQIYSIPKVLVYTPENSDEIYEIELVFDDHSYQESFYREYQRICRNTLKTLLPGLGEEETSALYDKLYAQTGELFLGDYYIEPDGSKPLPSALYRVGELGFYGYYGSGTANLCILPLTEEEAAGIGERGTEIVSLPE